jgi:hypothetical protein
MLQRVPIQLANYYGISIFNDVTALNTESSVLQEKND